MTFRKGFIECRVYKRRSECDALFGVWAPMRVLLRVKVAAVLLFAFEGAVCAGAPPPAVTSYIVRPHLMGNHVVGEARVAGGVSCYRDGMIGPPSFLVSDLYKPSTPKLPRDEFQIVKRLYGASSETLRFIHLPLAHPHLVLFDATLNQLCDPTHPPFKDSNGACNEYYSPLEDMDHTVAAPDC
jgi:hypothetical protein